MGYIHRLPFILGASVCVLTGIISYNTGSDKQEIYVRMAISLISFYFIGVFIRNTVSAINQEIEEKLNLEKLERERLEEEALAAMNAELQAQGVQAPGPTVVDYRVDSIGEDFTPLTVSEIINTNN